MYEYAYTGIENPTTGLYLSIFAMIITTICQSVLCNLCYKYNIETKIIIKVNIVFLIVMIILGIFYIYNIAVSS